MSLNSMQRKLARELLDVANEVGASPVERKAAIETGLVESNLSNPTGGDADSAGWRQERASIYKNPTNVRAAAERFFKEARGMKRPGISAGDLAARVQRPAEQYRGRYQQRSGEASSILASLSGQSQGAPGALGGSRASSTQTTTGGDGGAEKLNMLASLLAGHGNPDRLLVQAVQQKASVAASTPEAAQTMSAPEKAPSAKASAHASSQYGVQVAGGANRAGVGLTPGILKVVRQVAGADKHDLTIGTGTNHNQMTTSGNVSDHWDGNAADIPAAGQRLTKLGQDALIAAGMPAAEARKQTGGVYNLKYGKKRRIQILFNTHVGGNHFNHLHVGVSPNT